MHSVLINASYNGCRGSRVSVLIDYSAKGYFLTGQSGKCCILREYTEKVYQIQNAQHTVSGRGAELRGRKGVGFRTKGSLVRFPAGAHFVVALSKSHLPSALYWLNPGNGGRTTEFDRL